MLHMDESTHILRTIDSTERFNRLEVSEYDICTNAFDLACFQCRSSFSNRQSSWIAGTCRELPSRGSHHGSASSG
eukprot:m.366966 g.366966  ORF g.366966 m.366966 type:complete len:75 (-) comp28097_c0_seq9:3618-3842(-)